LSRFKLTIEFAGTRYRGWQIQKNARSVQGEIATAVRKLSNRTDFELYGAGRTDAGVHALGQVAHLDLNTSMPPDALRLALNDALPQDIHILSAVKVPRQFHARHDAKARRYLYQISRRRAALAKPFVWWIKDALAVEPMRRAAQAFLGLQDFRSFTDDDPEASSTRVLVEKLELAEAGPLILIRIEGSHFLWKMVRRLVGVLAEVGRGKLKEKDVARFLREASGVPASLTAPPSGLFLERVFYEGDRRDQPLEPVFNLASEPR
jgi:tRNA pseudouridine38-40 synthase